VAAGNSGDVPRAVIQRLEASDLIEGGGGRGNERDGSVFRLDKQFILPEQHVAESITATFPQTFSGTHIDTGKNAVIKAIDVVVEGHRFVEFEFQAAGGSPDLGRTLVIQLHGIEQHAAGIIAAAEKQSVAKAHGLGHIDLVLIGPRIEPE
jgi:hypothetical protein